MTDRPKLYWISGSPPAWRVMLALVLKDIPFDSLPLDHGKGENRTEPYLRINPRGRVPTLVHGPVVVRESIAILAYLDRAWPERSLFGGNAAEAAAIWQQVMEFESDLRPASTTIATTLLRGEAGRNPDALAAALERFLALLDEVEIALAGSAYLGGETPSAADCWLYPTLGWIDRAIARTTGPVAPELTTYMDRPALAAWRSRFGARPGISATYPPHWAN